MEILTSALVILVTFLFFLMNNLIQFTVHKTNQNNLFLILVHGTHFHIDFTTLIFYCLLCKHAQMDVFAAFEFLTCIFYIKQQSKNVALNLTQVQLLKNMSQDLDSHVSYF